MAAIDADTNGEADLVLNSPRQGSIRSCEASRSPGEATAAIVRQARGLVDDEVDGVVGHGDVQPPRR